jgi:Ca-activated chloride channel family protein
MRRRTRPHPLLLALAGLPLLLGIDLLRSKNRAVEEGNAQLKAGKAEEALGHYDRAVAKLPQDPGAHFNRGAALYALDRFDEAAQAFLRATETKAPPLKASAFYNLGNAFFRGEKYGDAVEAYKRALAIDPADQRAKWNLELALRKKREDEKKKQDQPQQQNKDQQNKDQQNKDQQKPDPQSDKGDGQDQDKKPGDSKKDEGEDPAKDEDKNAKSDPPPPEPGQDKSPQPTADDPKQDPQQAERPQEDPGSEPAGADQRQIDAILDSLERSPKALEQERARLRAIRRQPPTKDW